MNLNDRVYVEGKGPGTIICVGMFYEAYKVYGDYYETDPTPTPVIDIQFDRNGIVRYRGNHINYEVSWNGQEESGQANTFSNY